MSIFKKYGGRMIVTIVTIILLILIGLTARDREKITIAENTIGKFIAPVEKLFYNVGENIASTFKSIGNLSQMKKENVALKGEEAQLRSQNRKYENIINQSSYLKNEAVLRENTKYDLVNAQIIGKDPGNWFDRFIIDKGSKDGIKKNDPVIQAIEVEDEIIEEGLVGRVTEVGENWAKVVAIIDEGSNVSFNVIRTQDGGIVSGNVEGNLNGYLFDSKADIVRGDKLITSGLGGIFIKGLYIGEISEVTKKSDDLMKRVNVNTSVIFNKLNDVFIIIGNKE